MKNSSESENFDRVLKDRKEIEDWFRRHDRGEISIAHLIMETTGTWRIKGQLRPHKVLPPPKGPHNSPVNGPIFSADAPEDLRALERETVARLGAGPNYRPAWEKRSATKAPKAATKPPDAVHKPPLKEEQGDLFRHKTRLSDWLE